MWHSFGQMSSSVHRPLARWFIVYERVCSRRIASIDQSIRTETIRLVCFSFHFEQFFLIKITTHSQAFAVFSFSYAKARNGVAKKNAETEEKRIDKVKTEVSLNTLNEFSIHWLWLPRSLLLLCDRESIHRNTKKPSNTFIMAIRMAVWNGVSFHLNKKERRKNTDLRITVI